MRYPTPLPRRLPSLRNVLLATVLAVAAFAFGGCDGGGSTALHASSGVDRSKYLDQLTPDEIRELCTFAISSEGSSGDHVCGDAGYVQVYTLDQCTASDVGTNHCQVALLEDCMNALDGDACRLFASPALQDVPRLCGRKTRLVGNGRAVYRT